VLAQEVPIVFDKRKAKLQIVNPVEYFPEFKRYELYVGNDRNGWWNSKVKYVMNGGVGIIKWIGGYAFSVAKFITKQTFRGLGYVCNKIGDGFDDKRNHTVNNNRNIARIKNECISNNNMIGNDCFVEGKHGVYNKPMVSNCSNSYDDIPSFDTLMREYSNN
jgi:hypothetical protein